MGKKRSCTEGECDVAVKKINRKEHYLPRKNKDRNSNSDKTVKKHLKKSSHKHKSKRAKKKKKHYSDSSSEESSSSDSTSTCSSTSTDSEKKERKRKRRFKKEKKRHHKKSKSSEVRSEGTGEQSGSNADLCIGPLPPENLNKNAKSMAPMTKEEWEKRQSVVKRVYDEETGRHRLIKGDGEILEEIVSRDRHKEINRLATRGDGSFFENSIQSKLRSNNT